MELQLELVVVQEINPITNEVMEKQINPVPSSTGASFAILFNKKITTILISTTRKPPFCNFNL
jgi:hypothetical protein